MLKEILLGIGVLGLFIFVCIILLLPLLCTVILGIYIASSLGLTGIVWGIYWLGFIILFYIILMGILGMI